MSGGLFAAALACLGAGVLVDLVLGTRSRSARIVPYLLGLVAGGCLLTVGARATVSRAVTLGIGTLFGVGHGTLLLDPLAGLFLTVLFAVSVAVSACFVSWAGALTADAFGPSRGLASGYLLLLASAAVIVTATDAFVFLFAWESLTVSFYILTGAGRRRDGGFGTWATLGMGRASGAALLVGFLLLAGRSGSFTIATWHGVPPGTIHDAAWALIVVGFGAKVGLVPFHAWIPAGYPSAPGPARAAMAGIAANVGFYGLWRFLGVLGRPPIWLVIAVLVVGGLTALLGIAFAAVQSRLSRLVAYSSIENAGLIVTAYGVALTGAAVRSTPLVAVGLLAATLQTVAHAIAKSSLFSSLAFVEEATGTDDLDALRGIGRRFRSSGAAFGAGAVALAGLPPTIGFVSEWFILEALMQEFRLGGLALRLGLAFAGALVALTTGLAALTFLRVLGLAFLGRPPSAPASLRASGLGGPAGLPGKVGLFALGAACLGLAAVTPWEIRYLADGLSPLVGKSVTLQALKSPWVLQPVFHGFSILSPSWLWVAMPVAWVGVLVMAVLASRGRFLRVRRVPAWHSATAGVAGPSSYSAFGFANLLRFVLANVLGTQRQRQVLPEAGDRDDGGPGGDGAHIETRTTVVEPVERYLYRPLARAVLWTSMVARRLQSGRLNAYVGYMLVALLAALAITAALR